MKKFLNNFPLTRGLMQAVRPFYTLMRTRYMQTLYPHGGFVRCNGVRVFCDFRHKSHVWYCGNSPTLNFDQQVIRSLVYQGEGNVYIDIGAHFGFFAAYLAELLKRHPGSPRIFALEPDRDSFHCLEATMQQYAQSNIELLPYAISQQDGSTAMYRTDADCLHTYNEVSAEMCYEVPAISLDSFARKHLREGERIALIKIDVDGSEPQLFAGGEETICGHRPIIFMEFAPSHLLKAGENPHRMYQQLCERFHVYWASQSSRQLRSVSPNDYNTLANEIADRVTDLVLSSRPLKTIGSIPVIDLNA
jgi:FkbM family methyltransferase